MPQKPKTTRTLATVSASGLSEKLQCDIHTIYYHIRKLGLTIHRGEKNRIMLTPAQAEMIEKRMRVSRGAPNGGVGIGIDHTRAKVLIGALEKGATRIQLVLDHDASPEESDAACAWWQRAKSEFVLRPHVVEILTASVGKFETDDGFLLALEEALTSARSCAQCGTKVKTVMCSTCTPKPARPGPKPLTTTEQKPVGPDPIEEAKFKEIAKRLGLNDRADSYGPDSFTPLEDSK